MGGLAKGWCEIKLNSLNLFGTSNSRNTRTRYQVPGKASVIFREKARGQPKIKNILRGDTAAALTYCMTTL
jgi:hypothetical protein